MLSTLLLGTFLILLPSIVTKSANFITLSIPSSKHLFKLILLEYAILTVMNKLIDAVEDDFWTARLPFFTTQFPAYYREPQHVHGRFHASDERYFDGSREIIPPCTSS